MLLLSSLYFNKSTFFNTVLHHCLHCVCLYISFAGKIFIIDLFITLIGSLTIMLKKLNFNSSLLLFILHNLKIMLTSTQFSPNIYNSNSYKLRSINIFLPRLHKYSIIIGCSNIELLFPSWCFTLILSYVCFVIVIAVFNYNEWIHFCG